MIRRSLIMCAALVLIFVSLLNFAASDVSSAPVLNLPPLDPNVPACVDLSPNYTPAQHWTLNAPMPTARYGFATIAPNGLSSVYAIGGWQGWTDALTVNERFNACTNTWETLAPLPAPRGYVQAAEMNGRIYIVGGVDHIISGTFGVQSSVWVFDPAHNLWYTVANLPQALGGVALATANGRLYAFGGFDSRGPDVGNVNTVYEYDPSHDRWSLRSTIPGGARSLAGAAELNGEIYVVGGTAGSSWGMGLNEVYNPGTRTWRTAHPMVEGYYGLTLVKAPDGSLYALGGTQNFNFDYWFALQHYDPAADAWDYIATPEVNDYYNHGMSSGVYAVGRLFLMGGVGQTYGPFFSNTNESMHVLDSLCESNIQAMPDSATPGGHITYTIELRGEVNPLPNVILLDPIPDGTAFDGFVGNPSGASYNASEDQVEWHNPLPANPAPITITFKVRVNITGWMKAQFITNTMTIHNGLNVIARSASTWIDAFDLSPSSKHVNTSQTTAGGRQTYQLRVQSTSPVSGLVSLTDPVPIAVDYIADTLTATKGTASYANGVIAWSCELTPHLQTYTNTSSDYQWGDSLGNGDVPGVRYDWIEIERTGRIYGFFSPDNDRCYHTAFPFDFLFYDLHRTTASISTNGSMYFPDPSGYTNYRMGWDNVPIPSDYHYSGYDINHFIAPFWDDLNLMPGWIYYQIVGDAPNRKVVIEFANVTRRTGASQPGKPGSFEMIFYEGSSAIQFQYKDVNFSNPLYDNGASATVGIQGAATNGIQYSYNAPSLSDRLAILFLPPDHAYTYTADVVGISYIVGLSRIYPDQTPIINTATITSSFGQVITRETVSLYRWPNFASSLKTIDRSIAQPGEEITVTINADNTSVVPGIAEIADALPDGLTYVPGSLNAPAGYGYYANGLVWWRLQVPPHSQTPIQFRATIDGDVTHRQVITNTAVITTADYNVVLTSSARVAIDKPSDLFVTKIGPATIAQPYILTYTINYGNAGPFDADESNAIVDVLPLYASYISSTPSGIYSPTANTVTWNVGAPQTGTTQTHTLTVSTPEMPLRSVLTNTVNINTISQDPNVTNNLGQWFTRVGNAPNLLNYTAKTIDPTVASRGDVVTYTILIRNTGNMTAATTITDPIPLGASYQSGSSTIDGTPVELYDAASNQIRWNGSIASNEGVVICFRALIDTYSIVTNTVTIDDGADMIFDRSAATQLPTHYIFLPVLTK